MYARVPFVSNLHTLLLWWAGFSVPTQQELDGGATVPEEGSGLHILHPLQGDPVHLEDAVPHLYLTVASSCTRRVHASDVQALQLLYG